MSDIIPGLSIVVPVHNSGPRPWEALQQLMREPGRDDVEVIIVGDGFSGDTWEIAEELALGPWGFPIRILRPEVELGAVYLKGVSEARGEVVLLTAGDPSFGVTGTCSWEPVGDPSVLVISSKAHPGSVTPGPKLWATMSWGYRFPCRVILGMMVEGCQGTLLVNGVRLQRHIPPLREHGYLANTGIVHLAQVNRKRMVEVPVVLQVGHERGGTRIRIVDVWDMMVGLVRLCRRRHMPRVALKESRTAPASRCAELY